MTKIVKLSDICIKITDGSHYSPEGVIKGFPMFSVKDMRDNGFSYDDCKYISAEEFENMKANGCVPQINDILIAKDGSYLKHIFIVTENKDEAVLSSIGILRPNSELVNPYYIKYYLSSDFVKEQVAKKYVSGSALPRIILKNFANIEIPMINMELQNKIVNVLKSIDDKIENNNRINAELESMAKTIYDYWFLQFEFPNEDGKPYKSSGGKMVWNEELKREIPEGWKAGVIGNLFESQAGYAFKSANWKQSGHPVLTIKSIKEDGTINMGEASYIEEYDSSLLKYVAKNGNLIFAMSGNTIGKIGIIASNIDNILINQRVLIIKTDTSNIAYTYFIINDKKIQNSIVQLGANSAQPNISEDALRGIKICLPDKDLLEKYNQKCDVLFGKIIQNRIQNQELASLRDFLLPMLMNGQVGFKE